MGSTAEAYTYDAGTGEVRWMGQTRTYVLATGELTGGVFALVEERAIRGEAVPLHTHDDEVERPHAHAGPLGDLLRRRAAVAALLEAGRRLEDRLLPGPPRACCGSCGSFQLLLNHGQSPAEAPIPDARPRPDHRQGPPRDAEAGGPGVAVLAA